MLETVQKLAVKGISIVMNTHMPDHAFLVGSSAAALAEGKLVAVGEVATVVNSKMMSYVYGVKRYCKEYRRYKAKKYAYPAVWSKFTMKKVKRSVIIHFFNIFKYIN